MVHREERFSWVTSEAIRQLVYFRLWLRELDENVIVAKDGLVWPSIVTSRKHGELILWRHIQPLLSRA